MLLHQGPAASESAHSMQAKDQAAHQEHTGHLNLTQLLQVRWQGSDSEGWPILVIKVAKACAQCQGKDADNVAEAVISQVRFRLCKCHLYGWLVCP